jgi:hypothetical protein
MKVVVVLLLLSLAFAKISSSNNEDAESPEDVAAFRAMHSDEDHVLFFHNGKESQETGFFDSLFGIFGNPGDSDEKFQEKLAEKFPTLEVDTQIASLKNMGDDYEVPKLPYVIAYHNGREIWREVPTEETPEIIENLIKDADEANQNRVVYPAFHTSVSPAIREEVATHILRPQTITMPEIDFIDPYDHSFTRVQETTRRYEQGAAPRTRVISSGGPVNSVLEPEFRRFRGEGMRAPEQIIVEAPTFSHNNRRVVGNEVAQPIKRRSDWVETTPTNRRISRPNQASSTRVASTTNPPTQSPPRNSRKRASSDEGIVVKKFDADN